ncbi:MAG TPA: hypothetical protein VFH07_05050 [Chitinophagaceae bacterium]|jgi:hypothetical protein|nr:hypothetical protein [Chitinophagaceae bacterium]
MKKLFLLFFLFYHGCELLAQNSADTIKQEQLKKNADDPSQFITRIELFNELQHYDRNGNKFYVNQTTLRTILRIGKRFTTRVDLPYVYNTIKTPADYKQSGIGDISFRLLGYKFFEKPLSAFTASIEISMNTAASPILGTGKNVLIPVISYSQLIPKKKFLFSFVLQQANSVSGDDDRADISFSKLQAIFIRYWSRRTWTVLAPEWFLDYINGGVSMNLRTRMTYAPAPRINIWITPSAGIFGDFAGRYQWSLDIGGRFFLFREMNFNKK